MRIFNKVLIIVSLTLISFQSQARHRVGNGGHSVASHFSTIATNIARVWEDVCLNTKDKNAYCEYLKDYQDSLSKDSLKYIKVKAVDEKQDESSNLQHPCKIDESIREACNDGKNLIIVNSTKWKKLNSSAAMINLVLHEFFSVLELDSSDYYEYSMRLFSVLKHKGFLLDKIAAHEALPRPCSLKVGEKMASNAVKKSISQSLIKKSYSVKEEFETTRYELKLATKCNIRTFKASCAVFSELVDNYTNRNIFVEMFMDSGSRLSKTSLLKSIKRKINKKIKSCGN